MIPNGSQSVTLAKLKLKDIRKDERYSFSFPAGPPALFTSVKKTGIIQPVWVTPSTSGMFNLINGFRRLAAARKFQIEKIMALIFEGYDPFWLFLLSVEENASIRAFNQVELSFIVSTAAEKFNRPFDELMDVLFPLLGLSKSRNIYNWLLDVARFGPASHSLIARLKMPLGPARALADFEAEERETLCLWLSEKNFGLNRSVRLIEAIYEISEIEKISTNTVIQDAENNVPVDMEPPQRNEKLFENILTRRNPTLAQMEARFNASVKELKLPSGVTVIPPKNFEGRSLDFVIKAGDAKTAADSARSISEADKEKLARLFDWI